ncbi:uncharacterized protein N7498_008156 [Penicillium cinerascens]|uniref:Uncharacterized protein n=1 Tax=Penicillium cinerascens TaxID=70096 RepID=A0A9W9JDB5_9EURO|nr:uncharacterized protein N7498_008156 [Penicillium cinerascens]KAJ5194718.1 hypothetical protein N7498_008156 [Penicillium cinerascens]
MSPSHGLFARYNRYFNGPSVWNDKVTLSTDSLYETKSLYIVGFSFDVLTLAALICGVVWACLIRNHRGALKGVLPSLIAWLVAMILTIIEESLHLADAVVTQYYVMGLFLNVFFFLLSQCLLIFVFYNVIHKLLDRLTDTGKPYAAVVIIHWIVLALAVALAIATWALYVVFEVNMIQNSYGFDVSGIYSNIQSAQVIFYWVISVEMLAWSIFATVKAGSHRFVSKMPAIAFIIGSVFWFALNMMWAVVYIRYIIPDSLFFPRYLSAVESVGQFLFCVGIYVGVLLCCMNWSKVGDKPSGPMQHGPVPVGYPTYPAYQTYPQFSQNPQQYPPYMQQPYQQPYQQTY